jgi:ATP-dependent Clp protease ATP-binding subunit ClpA
VHRVVEKFVLQLEAQLADRGVTFELDEKSTAWLAERGYDERMGARPLGRLIQEVIKKPLAEEVLFGKLQKGGVVRVTVEDKAEGGTGLKLDCIPDENATRKERPPKAASPAGEDPAPLDAAEPPVKSPARSKKPKGGGSVPRVPLKA